MLSQDLTTRMIEQLLIHKYFHLQDYYYYYYCDYCYYCYFDCYNNLDDCDGDDDVIRVENDDFYCSHEKMTLSDHYLLDSVEAVDP